MQSEIEKLKQKLANKDELKSAEEVKELINTIQQRSLKLFEAAYKKMASQNQQQSSGADQSSNEQTGEQQADGESSEKSKAK